MTITVIAHISVIDLIQCLICILFETLVFQHISNSIEFVQKGVFDGWVLGRLFLRVPFSFGERGNYSLWVKNLNNSVVNCSMVTHSDPVNSYLRMFCLCIPQIHTAFCCPIYVYMMYYNLCDAV